MDVCVCLCRCTHTYIYIHTHIYCVYIHLKSTSTMYVHVYKYIHMRGIRVMTWNILSARKNTCIHADFVIYAGQKRRTKDNRSLKWGKFWASLARDIAPCMGKWIFPCKWCSPCGPFNNTSFRMHVWVHSLPDKHKQIRDEKVDTIYKKPPLFLGLPSSSHGTWQEWCSASRVVAQERESWGGMRHLHLWTVHRSLCPWNWPCWHADGNKITSSRVRLGQCILYAYAGILCWPPNDHAGDIWRKRGNADLLKYASAFSPYLFSYAVEENLCQIASWYCVHGCKPLFTRRIQPGIISLFAFFW